MQLFSADSAIFLKMFGKKFVPENLTKLPSKVAHNPPRPRVFSPASFFFVKLKKLKKPPPKVAQFFFQPCTAKRPKKKNSVFKMWLKESLSIALGFLVCTKF